MALLSADFSYPMLTCCLLRQVPTSPKVVGELNVTGFSAYLHPINDDNSLLLAVGQEANTEGRILGVQVTLFDASDPTKPTALHRYTVEQDEKVWSSSSVAVECGGLSWFARVE